MTGATRGLRTSAWSSDSRPESFFADSTQPLEWKIKENTNVRLRQHFPKGIYLSGYTEHELIALAHRLNTCPITYLHYATPLEIFTQLHHYAPVARWI
jgi:IS30 family transposase